MTAGANLGRFAARPVAEGGTPVGAWTAWDRRFDELDLAACPALVVVAPHPDDETLGLGATMATLAARGIGVDVVCVSDGGAAYPGLDELERADLEARRRAELSCATALLGVAEPIRLSLPDGRLAEHEAEITAELRGLLSQRPAGTWCAGTWRGDGHPDHEAVGRTVLATAQGNSAVALQYPVWMWHWASPEDPAVPWEQARRMAVTAEALERKAAAANCFRSQTGPGPDGATAIVPPFALERLMALGEVVFL